MISIGFQFGVELYSKKSIQKNNFLIFFGFVWILFGFVGFFCLDCFFRFFWIIFGFFSISIAISIVFFFNLIFSTFFSISIKWIFWISIGFQFDFFGISIGF